MTEAPIKHGNFDSLAGDYAQYRPGYAPSIVPAVLSLVGRPPSELDAADIGAGTGIWTRMLAAQNLHSITAVEPSDEMRRQGLLTSQKQNIAWRAGSAEETGLSSNAFDLVTMASSFHWPDFDKACAEFQRILRPGGRFVALWNPRMIELNPLLVEIEQEITRLNPSVKRVSSGRSGLTDRLTDMLWAKRWFRRRGLSGSPARLLSISRAVCGCLAVGQRFTRPAGAGFVQQVSGFCAAQDSWSCRNQNDLSDPRLGSAACLRPAPDND